MNFKLTGKEIRCFKIDALTSGCVNYDIAEFTFGEEWDNKTLTAVFRCGEDSEPVMKSLQNSKCVIPSEVLLNKNQKIEVGVIGIDADGVILRSKMCWVTTTYEGAPNGKEPTEITPTIYEQFVQDIHNDAVKSEECLKQIKSSVDGFDTHVLDKTSEFNDNAFEKLKEYNDNAANVDKFFQDKVIVATEKAAEANKSADAAKISENNSKISEYNALEYANDTKSSKEISETAKAQAQTAAATATQKAAEAAEHDILTQTSLTDVQKATARTNINAAPVDGSYELIETITLTENTASVVRTQEPDGTAYKLKAIGVVVSAEIGSVNSGISLMANYNATRLNSGFINGAISTSTKKYGYVQIYSEFGVWAAIGSTSVNGFGWTVTQMTGYSPQQAFAVKESENPYCTQMMLQTNMPSATIPAGTVISIYGVRA